MALYNVQDIYSSFSGDVEVGANGDLKLADSHESIKSAVNFLLRTDKGEYRPDVRVGADLGRYIGETNNTRNQIAMEHGIKDNISLFLMAPEDFEAHVIPLELNELGVFVTIAGQYMGTDGNLLDIETEILSYTFPYLEDSHPTPLI